MKLTYDKQEDIAYLKLTTNTTEANNISTESFAIDGILNFGEINLDFNDNNQIIGIEIFNASKNLPKELL